MGPFDLLLRPPRAGTCAAAAADLSDVGGRVSYTPRKLLRNRLLRYLKLQEVPGAGALAIYRLWPGSDLSTGQRPKCAADNSPDFWSGLAALTRIGLGLTGGANSWEASWHCHHLSGSYPVIAFNGSTL